MSKGEGTGREPAQGAKGTGHRGEGALGEMNNLLLN